MTIQDGNRFKEVCIKSKDLWQNGIGLATIVETPNSEYWDVCVGVDVCRYS